MEYKMFLFYAIFILFSTTIQREILFTADIVLNKNYNQKQQTKTTDNMFHL